LLPAGSTLHKLRRNGLKKAELSQYSIIFQPAHADAKPGNDNARYYAIHITSSQLLDKPRDASGALRVVVIANLQLQHAMP